MPEPEPVSELDGAFLVSPVLPDELPVEPDPLDCDHPGCKLNPTLAERASAVRIVLFAFIYFFLSVFRTSVNAGPPRLRLIGQALCQTGCYGEGKKGDSKGSVLMQVFCSPEVKRCFAPVAARCTYATADRLVVAEIDQFHLRSHAVPF
jgi:hypothetical protein